MGWALRDSFLAYVSFLKDRALRNYEMQLLVWAMLAPHQKSPGKAPAMPKILRG